MDRMETLEEAVRMFATIPWAAMSDQVHDASTNFTKVFGRWADTGRPCSLHIDKLVDFEKSEFFKVTKALIRVAPAPVLAPSDPPIDGIVAVGPVSNFPHVRDLLESLLSTTHFRCERKRTWWIPRVAISCRECPHLLTCVTKGWEVNTT